MKPQRIEEIYNLLNTFSIELEQDPTTLGQRYIQNKVALCREYLNSTSRILLEVQREYRNLSSQLHTEKSSFSIESDNLRATNPTIIRLPHDNDRTAHINMLLRDQRDRIMTLEREMEDMKMVEKAVKHRYDELKGTNTDIRTQRSTLRDELDTGAFYGAESDVLQVRKKTSVEDEELAKIMAGDWSASTPVQDEPTPAPVVLAPIEAPKPVVVVPAAPEPAKISEEDELMLLVETTLASTVPTKETLNVQQTVTDSAEFEDFMKNDLPQALPVSVKQGALASVSDDDFTQYLEGI